MRAKRRGAGCCGTGGSAGEGRISRRTKAWEQAQGRNRGTHRALRIQGEPTGQDPDRGLAVPEIAEAALEYNLQPPVTPVARQMYDLHAFIFWICVAIFVVVFAVMFYSIFRHRKSVGHRAAHFHESTTVEIIWTVIPFLILLFMAFPATKTILAMKDTTTPDMTIKVTGFQWKWNYDYLQEGFGFYSNLSTPLAQIEGREPKGENYLLEVDNPLVVPVDTKVRLAHHGGRRPPRVVGAGIRRQAGRDPGFVRDAWFRVEKVGTYRGQCAELCGKEHGFMPIVVDVKSKEDYKRMGRRAEDATRRGLC
jgi:cytochrome c oxidase subunit 2